MSASYGTAPPSESAPLLPRTNPPAPHEHPIFLRFCHSQWDWIGQKSLLALRGLFLVWTTAAFLTELALDTKHDYIGHRAKMFAWFPEHVCLGIQMAFYWLTTVCAVCADDGVGYILWGRV